MKCFRRQILLYLILLCFIHVSSDANNHYFDIYAVTMEWLQHSSTPMYPVFIDQLALSFNTHCNKQPQRCCSDNTSAYRALGNGLTFMTTDDIVTAPGFPRPVRERHVETSLIFRYKPNSELCRAVNLFSSGRGKRQAEFDSTQRVITADIVQDVLSNEMISDTEQALSVAIRDLLGYRTNVTIIKAARKTETGSESTTTGSGDSAAQVSSDSDEGCDTPWWVIPLIILAIVLLILLIIVLILLICWRRRRSRRGRNGRRVKRKVKQRAIQTDVTTDSSPQDESEPSAEPAAAAVRHQDVTSRPQEQPSTFLYSSSTSSSSTKAQRDMYVENTEMTQAVVTETARDRNPLQSLLTRLPDRSQGPHNAHRGNKYKLSERRTVREQPTERPFSDSR